MVRAGRYAFEDSQLYARCHSPFGIRDILQTVCAPLDVKQLTEDEKTSTDLRVLQAEVR